MKKLQIIAICVFVCVMCICAFGAENNVYFVRDGLDIGRQYTHPHGSNFPFLQNIQDWAWNS